MRQKKFFSEFENQEFDQAVSTFNSLSYEEQQAVMQQFYYQTREVKMPIVASILSRKLHADKHFEDFYSAWIPDQQFTKPVAIGDKIYHHFFEAPTRVINAINIQDPTEVISIGLIWCEEKKLAAMMESAYRAESNKKRADAIAMVADKISSKIYHVQSDTQLGS